MESGLSPTLVIVDAANVMGTRPDGWWRNRAAAAARLVGEMAEGVRTGRVAGPVAVVLEGAARRAPLAEADLETLRIIAAGGSGDDRIVELVADERRRGDPIVVVTADRGLRRRVESLGATVASPRWLLQRLSQGR